MTLTHPLNLTLYQAGDLYQGSLCCREPISFVFELRIILGASFNNFLDAVDGSYCKFEGGDDPSTDGIYPDNQSGGYQGTWYRVEGQKVMAC